METDDKLCLNPNEMAFRKIYWPLLADRKVTRVFRPGNRPCGMWRGYCGGQLVIARVLDCIGADWAKVAPQFVEGLEREIKIKEVVIKKISELVSEDYVGATPDIYDVISLQYNLGLIYNLFPEDIGPDSFVTITTFAYV